MPVKTIRRLTREFIRSHPDALFLFGDNEAREGFGGQAKEARGEPNAVGVRTKAEPSNRASAFWREEDHDRQARLIDEDLAPAFDAVRAGRTVFVPADGLGTGRAGLPERAPSTHRHAKKRLAELRRAASPDPAGQLSPGWNF